MPAARDINLISKATLDRNKRAQRRREAFLENLPRELAGKKFKMTPTPSRERIRVNETPAGDAYVEYKSSVTIDVVGGPDLPMEFQMTEIVLPSKPSNDE